MVIFLEGECFVRVGRQEPRFQSRSIGRTRSWAAGATPPEQEHRQDTLLGGRKPGRNIGRTRSWAAETPSPEQEHRQDAFLPRILCKTWAVGSTPPDKKRWEDICLPRVSNKNGWQEPHPVWGFKIINEEGWGRAARDLALALYPSPCREWALGWHLGQLRMSRRRWQDICLPRVTVTNATDAS